jgi:hypothetical protein
MSLTTCWRCAFVVGAASIALIASAPASFAQDRELSTTREMIAPDAADVLRVPQRALSPVERDNMLRGIQERREAFASQAAAEASDNGAAPDE